MELKKLNEQYSIKDTTKQGWSIIGGVTIQVDDHLNIYWDVISEDVKIGSLNYLRPTEGNATISYSIPEDLRVEFMIYSEDLLSEILENFKKPEDEVGEVEEVTD